MSFFIGDEVDTPKGKGYVEGVVTWRDRIEEMDDFEAIEFSSQCKREVGNDFREKWNEITVSIKGKNSETRFFIFKSDEIKVIHGREEERDVFARKESSK